MYTFFWSCLTKNICDEEASGVNSISMRKELKAERMLAHFGVNKYLVKV